MTQRGEEMGELVAVGVVRELVRGLDLGEKWTGMLAKDVPSQLTNYVVEQARLGKSIDSIRESMGMTSGTDLRWKKIMAAVRQGRKIDATGVFVKWMERNERLGDQVEKMVNEMVNEQKPMSKMMLEGLRMISSLQLDTIKMGKELGIFTDGLEKGQAGQGVTIVVQTNVPMPSKEVIIEHQNAETEKQKALLEQYRNADEIKAPEVKTV